MISPHLLFISLALWLWLPSAFAQPKPQAQPVGGVFPNMTTVGGMENPSEAAFGALIPWANKLWAVSYVSHIEGSGTGLYEIEEREGELHFSKRLESVVGTYANRMMHYPSGQAVIGPFIIDSKGYIRTIEDLKGYRLTATCAHLTDPENKVYFLGMEGHFWEMDVHSLKATQLFDLNKELRLPEGVRAHYKGAFTANGRVVIANNTYHEQEHLGTRKGGRLAEWEGGDSWTILDDNPYIEVSGMSERADAYGNPMFALGWDKASVIFKLHAKDEWKTYRLPKGSHSFDHAWNTEWFRIRQAQTERFIMDAHGIFYELPAQVYEKSVWGIKPISYHLRIVPDFCFFRGLFVMAGNQTDLAVGQPQSGLWFGNIDDLWSFGKPQGWGGPWWESEVQAGTISDPFLMTGFDKKTVHLSHNADEAVTYTLEVDFLGNGTWKTYDEITVPPHGYAHHQFPDAFSAHWVRVRVNQDCTTSVYFVYT